MNLTEREEDRPAYVQFEIKSVKDPEATLAAGHHVSKDEHWVLVTPFGSRDCFTQRADKWFKNTEREVSNGRIPHRHMEYFKEAYRRFKDGLEDPVDGTPLKDWNAISPAQFKNLISAGCRSIEDVSAMNDEILKRYGPGGVELKRKAHAWLHSGKGHLTEKMESLERENEQLRGTIKSLQDQINIINEKDGRAPIEITVEKKTNFSIDEMREMYKKKKGKYPHSRMKEEKLKAILGIVE